MSFPLLIVIVVVIGLLIGSFLTVVAERVPEGGSVVAPPSRCGSCGLRLGPLDLVPVVSWLALRGKCRQCGAPIGIEPHRARVDHRGAVRAVRIEVSTTTRCCRAFCILAGDARRADLDRPADPAPAARDHVHRDDPRRHRARPSRRSSTTNPSASGWRRSAPSSHCALDGADLLRQQGWHGLRRRDPGAAARHVPRLAEPRHRGCPDCSSASSPVPSSAWR